MGNRADAPATGAAAGRRRGRLPWLFADTGETHAAMMAAIEEEVACTAHHTGRHALSPRVDAAMRAVPRALFVPERERALAYANHPLPIGHGQTISQPFIVAIMTELLDLDPADTVLEIGTGSGYQAAVLARLARQVYSVEVVPELAAAARAALARLGCANVAVRAGDGAEGWAEHAPFDAVIVTAAAPAVPPALLSQLKPGGRLVAPLDTGYDGQMLTLVRKDAHGRPTYTSLFAVRFVPLTAPRRR